MKVIYLYNGSLIWCDDSGAGFVPRMGDRVCLLLKTFVPYQIDVAPMDREVTVYLAREP